MTDTFILQHYTTPRWHNPLPLPVPVPPPLLPVPGVFISSRGASFLDHSVSQKLSRNTFIDRLIFWSKVRLWESLNDFCNLKKKFRYFYGSSSSWISKQNSFIWRNKSHHTGFNVPVGCVKRPIRWDIYIVVNYYLIEILLLCYSWECSSIFLEPPQLIISVI